VEITIIPPADALGIFPVTIKASSQSQTASVVETNMELSIAAQSSISSNVSLLLDRNQLTVDPGETISTTLILYNRSNITDNFSISVLGVSQEWTSIQLPAIELSPSGSKATKISFHPPRTQQSSAGTHPFSIK
jgi:uncharacterized membrane protein